MLYYLVNGLLCWCVLDGGSFVKLMCFEIFGLFWLVSVWVGVMMCLGFGLLRGGLCWDLGIVW